MVLEAIADFLKGKGDRKKGLPKLAATSEPSLTREQRAALTGDFEQLVSNPNGPLSSGEFPNVPENTLALIRNILGHQAITAFPDDITVTESEVNIRGVHSGQPTTLSWTPKSQEKLATPIHLTLEFPYKVIKYQVEEAPKVGLSDIYWELPRKPLKPTTTHLNSPLNATLEIDLERNQASFSAQTEDKQKVELPFNDEEVNGLNAYKLLLEFAQSKRIPLPKPTT